MNAVILRSTAADGSPLEATFLPDQGMTLSSYKKGEIEVIAQSTRTDFDQRRAGLGPLIGPHFHRRPDSAIHPVAQEERYPVIAAVHAHGSHDPFSHGIARYAPWRANATLTTIEATLSGEMGWNGSSIADLEGQMFSMHYKVALTPDGLALHLSIDSEGASVVGFHTYYHLEQGKGVVTSRVHPQYRDLQGWHSLPPDWDYDQNHRLTYPLNQETDWGFSPFPDPLLGEVTLTTESHELRLRYSAKNAENSWQLWHPKGAPFVCIEPLSAKDPRHPHLTQSSLTLRLQINPTC